MLFKLRLWVKLCINEIGNGSLRNKEIYFANLSKNKIK